MAQNDVGCVQTGCGCVVLLLIVGAVASLGLVDIEDAGVKSESDGAVAEAKSVHKAPELSMSSEGETGIGGVLLKGKIPRKIVAKGDGLLLYDKDLFPLCPLQAYVPYFVFEENDDYLLVGRVQERDVAIGFVARSDCYSWSSRRAVYPRPDGKLTAMLNRRLEAGMTLPPLRPREMMPWPILHESEDGSSWRVFADCSSFGKAKVLLNVPHDTMDDFAIYVLFTSRELMAVMSDMAGLMAIMDSGRMPIDQTPRVLGAFVTQNNVDFVDLTELRKATEAFPGGSPDPLVERLLREQLEVVYKSLGDQLDVLRRIEASLSLYNEAHATYVVPLSLLYSKVYYKKH